MPWSAKAGELLRKQYAPVGSAAAASLEAALHLVSTSSNEAVDLSDLEEQLRKRRSMVEGYIDSYRRYCWSVDSLSDLELAPFHVMASEGAVHSDREHAWHLEVIARVCAEDSELLTRTATVSVDVQERREP